MITQLESCSLSSRVTGLGGLCLLVGGLGVPAIGCRELLNDGRAGAVSVDEEAGREHGGRRALAGRFGAVVGTGDLGQLGE
jgi:hypothetical protein